MNMLPMHRGSRTRVIYHADSYEQRGNGYQQKTHAKHGRAGNIAMAIVTVVSAAASAIIVGIEISWTSSVRTAQFCFRGLSDRHTFVISRSNA